MWCPYCESTTTTERRERTELGYRRFRCRTCKREFNERTGTRFNHLQYPPISCVSWCSGAYGTS
jgi:putative transposase